MSIARVMPDIAKPALFLDVVGRQQRARVRKQAFFQSDQEDQRKLQALGRVQRHQRDARALVVLIGVADQRGVVEKFRQRLAAVARIHGRIHQFAQVLDARQRLRRVFPFQQLDVAGAIDQELQQLSGRRRIAGRAKALDASLC